MEPNKPFWPQVPFAAPFDVTVENQRHVNPGMTLRDYFAAKALPTVLATAANPPRGMEPADFVAFTAYAIADAMLRAREAK